MSIPSVASLESLERLYDGVQEQIPDFSWEKAHRDNLIGAVIYQFDYADPLEIRARCKGKTGVYELILTEIAPQTVELKCSCPAFMPWKPCKHLAALAFNLHLLMDKHLYDTEVEDSIKPERIPEQKAPVPVAADPAQKKWVASLRALRRSPTTDKEPAKASSQQDNAEPSAEAQEPAPPKELFFGINIVRELGFCLQIWGATPGSGTLREGLDYPHEGDFDLYSSISDFLAEDCNISSGERDLLRRLQRLESLEKKPYDPKKETLRIKMQGHAWQTLLPALVETGKVLHLQHMPYGRFSWHPSRPASCIWQKTDEGLYRPHLKGEPGKIIDCGEQLAWINMDHAEISWLEFDRPVEDVLLWMNGPELDPVQLALSIPDLEAAGLPLPPENIRVEQLPDVQPTPVIRLGRVENDGYYHPPSYIVAVPQVRYHDQLIDISDLEETEETTVATLQQSTEDKTVVQIVRRNRHAETQIHQQLKNTHLYRISLARTYFRYGNTLRDWRGGYTFSPPMDYQADRTKTNWQHFHFKDLPRLLAAGWEITYDDELQSPLLDPPAESWTASLAAAADTGHDYSENNSGIDWFALSLGVEIDGQRLDLVRILQSLLADKSANTLKPDKHGRIVVLLEDGRALLVPERIARLALRLVFDLFNHTGSPRVTKDNDISELMLAPLQAAGLLEAAPELIHTGRGTKALKKLADQLRNFSGIKQVAPPKRLNAELRSYQQEGLSWLQFLRESSLHGILADDMGLGKTVQTIAHLLKEKAGRRAKHPSLVVAPTSVLHNWLRETQRFAPTIRALIHHGLKRDKNPDTLNAHDLVITSYALLNRDAELLSGIRWHLVVLDEAQAIKNPKAKVSIAARELTAKHRLCLSGTPFENHLGELWSLFDFLIPGYLADATTFRRIFRTPIEKHGNLERQQILADRVRPLLLRRRKEEVALDLPPKSHIEHTIELHRDQQTLYETVRAVMDKRVREAIAERGLARSSIIVLDAMLKLRQICCHPSLLKKQTGKRVTKSAKLERLMEILPKLVEEGRRILLFSQFTSMLELIEAELAKTQINWIKLTGSTRNRAELVEQFQTGDIPVFLISLKAGGTGLNLTAADTVIHYDPWWNPAVEAQATDRAHRIGQDKPVFVHRLICRASIEQHIQELQAKKQGLVDAVLSGDTAKLRLDQSDIDHLLQPLTAVVESTESSS